MSGREWIIDDGRLKNILEQEFGIFKENWKAEELEKAREALFVYRDRRDFLSATRWDKDNPEYDSEEYLTTERICRWIDGEFVYFSRLLWEPVKEES